MDYRFIKLEALLHIGLVNKTTLISQPTQSFSPTSMYNTYLYNMANKHNKSWN